MNLFSRFSCTEAQNPTSTQASTPVPTVTPVTNNNVSDVKTNLTSSKGSLVIGTGNVNNNDNLSKNYSINVPDGDLRTYSVRIFNSNGIRSILVRDVREENILVRMIIKLGECEMEKELSKQVEEYVLDRITDIRLEANGQFDASLDIYSTHIQLDLRTTKAHFDADMSRFSKIFNNEDPLRNILNHKISIDSIIEKISKGKRLSTGEFGIFVKEILLKSDITFISYGDIIGRMTIKLSSVITSIRSGISKKILPIKDAKSMNTYLIKKLEGINDNSFIPGCYMTMILPSEDDLCKGNLLEAIERILKNKFEDEVLYDILKEYGDVKVNFEVLRSQSDDPVLLNFTATVADARFKNHEKLSKDLFSYFEDILKISEEEYQEFINSINKEFESKVSKYTAKEIVNILDSGYRNFPEMNILDYSYNFTGLSRNAIVTALKKLSNDWKWNITTVSSVRSKIEMKEIPERETKDDDRSNHCHHHHGGHETIKVVVIRY